MKFKYYLNEKTLVEIDSDKILALSVSPDINISGGTIKELEDVFGLGSLLKKKYPNGFDKDVYFVREDRYLLLVVQSEGEFYKSISAMCDYIIENDILDVHMYRVGNIHESTPWETTEKILNDRLKDSSVVLNIYINDPK